MVSGEGGGVVGGAVGPCDVPVWLGDVPWYFMVFCGSSPFHSAGWVSHTTEYLSGLSLMEQLEEWRRNEVHVGRT